MQMKSHDVSTMPHENDLVQILMDSLPCGVMILDHQAQVVAINKALEKIFGPSSILTGKGAGQSIGCVWALGRANGCGHAAACSDCKMRRVVLSALNGKQVINEKTSFELLVDGAVKHCTLQISIAPVAIHNRSCILFLVGPSYVFVFY